MKFILYFTLLSTVLGGTLPPAPVYSNCVNRGQIALTFDDGPSEKMPLLIQILTQENVIGTAFIRMDGSPRSKVLLKQAFDSKRLQIGSHGFNHTDMTKLTGIQQAYNIVTMQNEIQAVIGVKPAFFRPPFGLYNSDTLKAAKYLGNKAVVIWNNWDFDFPDSMQKFDNFKKHFPTDKRSFILLMHDWRPATVETNLRPVIRFFKSQNYKFVSIAECLGLPGFYQ